MPAEQVKPALERDQIIVSKMAHRLNAQKIDLGDERAVLRDLAAAGFSNGDVLLLCAKAISVAKQMFHFSGR